MRHGVVKPAARNPATPDAAARVDAAVPSRQKGEAQLGPWILLLCAAVIAALRLASGNLSSIDFGSHYDIATAIAHGENAFSRVTTDALASPAIGVLYSPFLVFSRATAAAVFFVVNVCALTMLLRLTLGSGSRVSSRPLSPWAACVLAALIVNASPTLETLRLGQVSALLAFFLLRALLLPEGRSAPFALAAAMVLKSTFGALALPLLSWRHFRLCILGVAAFVAVSLAPALFGCNLWSSYASSAERLHHTLGAAGINNAAVHGSGLLNFDLFRNPIINLCCKGLAGAVLLAVLVRDYRLRRSVTLNTLVLAATVTLTVVYHRLHDALVLLPLLGLLTLGLWQQGRRTTSAFAAVFLLWFEIPESLILRAEETLGASSRWLITSPYRPAGLHHLMPLNACLMLLLLLFAAWVSFCEPAITFESKCSVPRDARDTPQAARIAH